MKLTSILAVAALVVQCHAMEPMMTSNRMREVPARMDSFKRSAPAMEAQSKRVRFAEPDHYAAAATRISVPVQEEYSQYLPERKSAYRISSESPRSPSSFEEPVSSSFTYEKKTKTPPELLFQERAGASAALDEMAEQKGWDLPLDSRQVTRLAHYSDGTTHLLFKGDTIVLDGKGKPIKVKYSEPSKAISLPDGVNPALVQSHTEYPSHTKTVERGGRITYAIDGKVTSSTEKRYMRDGKYETVSVNGQTGVKRSNYQEEGVAAARKFYDKNFERSEGNEYSIDHVKDLPDEIRRIQYKNRGYSEKVDANNFITKKMFTSSEIPNLLQKDPELHALISKFKTDISPSKPHLDLDDIAQISQEGSKFKIKLKSDPIRVVRLDAATGRGEVSKIAFRNGYKIESTANNVRESHINDKNEKITTITDADYNEHEYRSLDRGKISTTSKQLSKEDGDKTFFRNEDLSMEAKMAKDEDAKKNKKVSSF